MHNIRLDAYQTAPWFCVFVFAICVDIFLGTVAAWANKTANSAASRTGMLRKFAMLGVVLGLAVADGLFPSIPIMVAGNTVTLTLAAIACAWWCVTEAQSILENLGVLGVPVPKFARERLIQLRKSLEDAEAERQEPS